MSFSNNSMKTDHTQSNLSLQVNHLHLHILGLPCVTWFDKIKYRPSATPSRNKHKGFSHFVEIDQTMAILQAQGKVGVLPC
jgi:hypothetical protein